MPLDEIKFDESLGSCCCYDCSAYDNEIKRQLSNTIVYCKLHHNPTEDFK